MLKAHTTVKRNGNMVDRQGMTSICSSNPCKFIPRVSTGQSKTKTASKELCAKLVVQPRHCFFLILARLRRYRKPGSN